MTAVGTSDYASVIGGDNLRGTIESGGGTGDVGPVGIIRRGLPLIRDATGDGLTAQGQVDVLSGTSEYGIGGRRSCRGGTGTCRSGCPGKDDIGARGLRTIIECLGGAA